MLSFSQVVKRGVVCAGSVVASGLVLAAAAHADTFQVNGTLASGATFSGTVNVDFVAQRVLRTDFTVTGAGLTGVAQSHDPGDYYGGFLGSVWELSASYFPGGPTGRSSTLDLLVQPASLAGGSGPLCSVSAPCANFGSSYLEFGLGSYDQVTSGTISPVAATPEPGTLALLGTGVLGAVGAVRRRMRG